MRQAAFPEFMVFKAPSGTKEAVREAAGQEGQTLSEFIRAAVRAQLRRVAPATAVHAGGD